MQQIIDKAFSPLSALNLLVHSQPDANQWGCVNAGSAKFNELGQQLANSVPLGTLANLGVAAQGINKCM